METKELKFNILEEVMRNPDLSKQDKMFFFEKKMRQLYMKKGNKSYAQEFRMKGCPDRMLCNPEDRDRLKEVFGDVIKVFAHQLVESGKIVFRWNQQ